MEKKLAELRKEFEVGPELLNKCVSEFINQATGSLAANSERGIPMIPTYVTSVPTGEEKGLFLAADLGGSNFRVCSVDLHGDSTHTMKQQVWKLEKSLMRGSSAAFFSFLTDCIHTFLEKHHGEKYSREHIDIDPEPFKMGFTFSFPVDQTGLRSGHLKRWTKDFDIQEAVGQDIVLLLQSEIDKRRMPVYVAALINDTVGCLMARAYKSGSSAQTVMGVIAGTGTNAAYSEVVSNIPKFEDSGDSKLMVVNTEWGSFDNDLHVLPVTRFDKAVDLDTPNVSFHMFEKRVSGMYLGELTRRVLVELQADGLIFQDDLENSDLHRAWSANTSVPSLIEGDTTPELTSVGQVIADAFGYSTSPEERKAIRAVCEMIGKRSAALVASATAGLLILNKALDKFDKVDIGFDGSVYEHYPHFEERIRAAWRQTDAIGDKEARISMGLARDGSGIGAALAASTAP